MTDHYARAALEPSSLDITEIRRRAASAALTQAALTQADDSRNAHGMTTQDRIAEKLNAAFSPSSLDVQDESHQHAGHAGSRPGGETHFRVYIVSAAFEGKSRIERHRMVNAALAQELAGGVHALAIHASAPGEPR
jgi:BolA family transcriptional regulator, general stress-responsive regulator